MELSPDYPIIKAHEILVAGRLGAVSKDLDRLHATEGDDTWYSDTLMNLFSELAMQYAMVEKEYNDKDRRFAIARPATLAWRARNMLELSIWTAFCYGSRDNARRFYEDKHRDMLNWVTSVQKMVALLPDAEIAWRTFPIESKARITKVAEDEKIADIDESFTKINAAAVEIGLDSFFLSMNKFFSKFAHPTALTVLTFPDEATRAMMCHLFCVMAAIFFILGFEEMEKHVTTILGQHPD